MSRYKWLPTYHWITIIFNELVRQFKLFFKLFWNKMGFLVTILKHYVQICYFLNLFRLLCFWFNLGLLLYLRPFFTEIIFQLLYFSLKKMRMVFFYMTTKIIFVGIDIALFNWTCWFLFQLRRNTTATLIVSFQCITSKMLFAHLALFEKMFSHQLKISATIGEF